MRQGVNIEFIPFEPKEFEKHDLDRSWADDRLLASILQYNEQHVDMPTFLVTDDFPMTLKATTRGIALLKMPEEYRLPIQPDPEEAKIKELQKRLNDLPQDSSCDSRVVRTIARFNDHPHPRPSHPGKTSNE